MSAGEVGKNRRFLFAVADGGFNSVRGERIADFGHVIAAFWTGINISLGQKLSVCPLNGDGADIQMLGKRTLGGQLFIGAEAKSEDVGLDRLVKMLVKAVGASVFK